MLQERFEERQKRQDYRAGLVASIVANVNRDAQKQPRPWDWTDFFPFWKDPDPEQSEEEMFGFMRAFASASQRRQLPS